MDTNNKRSCVILHLFYQYLWDEIKEYLLNLQEIADFDLFITCTSENKQLFNEIKKTFNKNINVYIEIVENTKGADIYPFFYVLNKINLNDYDLIYKIHTKQNITNELTSRLPKFTNTKFYIGNNIWRNLLLEGILGRTKIIKVRKKFYNNSRIGMSGFGPLLVKYNTEKYDIFPDKFEEISTKYKFKYIKEHQCYVGTIFVIRANLLKCLQNRYDISDFQTNTNEKFATITWQMEHLFGYIVEAQGYKIYNSFKKSNKIIMGILSSRRTLFLYKYYLNNFIFKRQLVK